MGQNGQIQLQSGPRMDQMDFHPVYKMSNYPKRPVEGRASLLMPRTLLNFNDHLLLNHQIKQLNSISYIFNAESSSYFSVCV